MKRVSAMVLVGVLVGGTVGQAQAPLSTALLDARSVYVAGTGVERKWVDRMAEEIQNWIALRSSETALRLISS